MSRSKKLFKLQKIDSAIDTALTRISEIESILADEEELIRAQKKEKDTRLELKEKKKILQRAEREVRDQERKISKNKEKLYSGKITNPKELEDLQLEADSLERYLAVLEERQLEAMIVVDQYQTGHKEALEALRKVKENRKKLHADLNQEKSKLENDIEALKAERKNALEGIPDEDLELYEDLRQTLGGIAVAKTNEQSCSACGTQIPSAVYQKARSASQLTNCKTCQRILHAE